MTALRAVDRPRRQQTIDRPMAGQYWAKASSANADRERPSFVYFVCFVVKFFF